MTEPKMYVLQLEIQFDATKDPRTVEEIAG
jgi:hypothetical protein